MSTSASAFGAEATGKSVGCSPTQMLATLGVSIEEFGIHQEKMRRSFRSPQATHPGYHHSLPPFPLNLPSSYPTSPSPSAFSASTRHPRPGSCRRGASVIPNQVSETPAVPLKEYARAPSVSYSKGKAKRSLDAFMDSRQGTRPQETDSSASDSDTSLIKMLRLPHAADSQDALPPSSPPSSSPIHTPRESSPIHTMYGYPSSPTPRPKRQCSVRLDASDAPYTLPAGPYSRDKPSWSLAALIGQAINASHTGALPLNDLYTYISTVYPYYNRGDQPWMSSVRHSLSVNDAFERVPDQDGNSSRKGRGKGMTRLKGGLWRIKPGHHACFEGGNFVRRGAKGPGPGKNQGGRKRLREGEEERSDKKLKVDEPSLSQTDSFSHSNFVSSSSSSQRFFQTLPGSSDYPNPPAASGDDPPRPSSVVPPSTPLSLRSSQPTPAMHSSFNSHGLPTSSPMFSENASIAPGIASPGSPDLPLALTLVRRRSVSQRGSPVPASLLEPGFELEVKRNQQSSPEFVTPQTNDQEVNRELFTRVFSRTSSVYPPSSSAGPSDSPKATRLLFPPPLPSSSLPGSSSSLMRPVTPPPSLNNSAVTLSPVRTPMSHRGLHMSPSRSLVHYKSSLEPEWKSTNCPTTPPPNDQDGEDRIFSTPNRPSFPSNSLQISPFRTPARPSRSRNGKGYDPYDPDTLLADEIASIRKASELQESPGGFFGKEGRKLLYESPSMPGQSDWRFRDEL